jgi:hypothetical protein
VPVVLRAPLRLRLPNVLGFLALAVVSLGGHLQEEGPLSLLALAGSGLCVAAAARAWLIRIEMYDDRLVLVNWTRTVAIPWTEVAKSWADEKCLHIRTTDYDDYKVAAFRYDNGLYRGIRREAGQVAVRITRRQKKRR